MISVEKLAILDAIANGDNNVFANSEVISFSIAYSILELFYCKEWLNTKYKLRPKINQTCVQILDG